jgi:hypothetical protein
MRQQPGPGDRERFARSTTRAWLACAALTSASCADEGQSGGLHKPTAPEMRTLDAYDAPTAAITVASMDDLLGQAAIMVAAIDAVGIERTFIHSLSAGLSQLDQGSTPQIRAVTGELAVQTQALTLPGNGYVEVWRICDGWGAAPVANPENGELHVIAGFDQGLLDPIVWGTVTGCRYRMGEREVQLDSASGDAGESDVRMLIGKGLELGDLASLPEPVIVELAARATVDGREVSASLDFRIDVRTRALELLVPLDSGHVLVAIDAARGAMQARATNGTFSCEAVARRCTGADGEELRLP